MAIEINVDVCCNDCSDTINHDCESYELLCNSCYDEKVEEKAVSIIEDAITQLTAGNEAEDETQSQLFGMINDYAQTFVDNILAAIKDRTLSCSFPAIYEAISRSPIYGGSLKSYDEVHSVVSKFISDLESTVIKINPQRDNMKPHEADDDSTDAKPTTTVETAIDPTIKPMGRFEFTPECGSHYDINDPVRFVTLVRLTFLRIAHEFRHRDAADAAMIKHGLCSSVCLAESLMNLPSEFSDACHYLIRDSIRHLTKWGGQFYCPPKMMLDAPCLAWTSECDDKRAALAEQIAALPYDTINYAYNHYVKED